MDSYSQVLRFLFSQLPNYQKQGGTALKLNLLNIESFIKRLKNPHEKIKTIHVAGTNGKGSVSHIIASILQSKGLKVGIYSSPHLVDFRERIKINGEYINQKYILDFVNFHYDFMTSKALSFFEMTVGLAFDYFSNQKVDIAIIEVGMGGRLDATNIIKPEISVITNIGIDHTEFLGNSISKIAKEKAGIIKKGIPVLIGEHNDETAPIFFKKAESLGSKIIFIEDSINKFKSDLSSLYQQKNINTAINAVKLLPDFKISNIEIESAILEVKKSTRFIGRWDMIAVSPKIFADVTHNTDGFKFMIKQLKEESYNKLHLVLGFVKEKDVKTILKLLPFDANYYLCSPSIDRAMSLSKLSNVAKGLGISYTSHTSVKNALFAAKQSSNPEDLIVVSGSTFVVAEIM